MSRADRQEAIKKAAQLRVDGLTLQEIGDELGVSGETIRNWEKTADWASVSGVAIEIRKEAKKDVFNQFYNKYVESFREELEGFEYKQKISAHQSMDISNKIDSLILAHILKAQEEGKSPLEILQTLRGLTGLITANSNLKRQTNESIEILLGLQTMLGEIGENGAIYEMLKTRNVQQNKESFTPKITSFS